MIRSIRAVLVAMPVWYHLLFLGLQVPGYLAGAAFRSGGGGTVPAGSTAGI